MPPRKETNRAKTEKSAELKEGWAEHLPLKYDDKTYGDRFGIQFFVENFNSNVVENSSDKVVENSSDKVDGLEYSPT